MALTISAPWPARSGVESIIAQGTIERALPHLDDPCTARLELAKAEASASPFANGFFLKRGLLAGEVAEQVIATYAANGHFPADLGAVVQQAMARMDLRSLSAER